ncbi:SH3 and PX domain-containing protein 2B-like [Oopsacas minuta]|uniref:SH3 and PX domain-containing protein 2B-like n=1 Tax=Oopsacas minuta TaxID=111878 RepID=A0AAV7KIH3_9METZ|nr:SH3 and PX domain-containing protein 2B-like [Oopsacas minuta]
MSVRSVQNLSIQGLEKRMFPSKHYVYVIQVTWTTGAANIIYRRYSQFFEFQLSLLTQFPVEGGRKNPEDRVIPFLPGKILFGRSHVRGVAEQRLGPLGEYLDKLLALPSISTCQIVSDFFGATDEDIKPIREKQKSIRETEARNISDPILLEQWVAIADFNKEKRSQCSLKEGSVVDVVEKKASGWWFIENSGNQGWVPASYLEPVSGGQDDEVEKCAPG